MACQVACPPLSEVFQCRVRCSGGGLSQSHGRCGGLDMARVSERFEDKADFTISFGLKDFFSAFVRYLWNPPSPCRVERHQRASSTSFLTRPATLRR
jgi:hypothetical protein